MEEKDVRLDKWLWAARFYKTRSIAKAMIEGGKVHYNGQRTKVSKIVEVGARIKLRQGNEEKEVKKLLGQERIILYPCLIRIVARTKKSGEIC